MWIEKCFEQKGVYPHPLFRDAGFEGRVVLFSGAAAVLFEITWGLKRLCMMVNGKEAWVDGREHR